MKRKTSTNNMNISAAAMKRARSGNFNREEIDLLLGLVEEHKVLVDSAKQDDKKKVLNKQIFLEVQL